MKALSKTREAFKDTKIGFVGRGCAPNPALGGRWGRCAPQTPSEVRTQAVFNWYQTTQKAVSQQIA